MIRTAWRRWLGFLAEHYPDDLLKPPADRITPERVRAFIEHLAARGTADDVAHVGRQSLLRRTPDRTDNRLALAGLDQGSPCCACAHPEDRFDRLVPPWHTFDLGIELMDEALSLAPEQRPQATRAPVS